MAMQTTGEIPLGNNAILMGTAGNSIAHALDAADDAIAAVYHLPGGKTVTHIGFLVTALAGTLPTYRASLQGLSSRGTPNGTVLGGGSPASATFNGATVTATGWYWIALDNNYAVPSNGIAAAVALEHSSGTVDASNNMTARAVWASDSTAGKGASSPYVYLRTAGTWASAHASRRWPGVCVRFSDGTIALGGFNITGVTLQSFALNSSNPERGVKINRPYGFRLVGIEGMLWPANDSADFNLKVYLGSSSSPTVNKAFDVSHELDVVDERICRLHHQAVEVAANESCYVVIAPSVNSQNVAFHRMDYSSADERARMFPGLHHVIGSGGSWTDQTSGMPAWTPVIDAIDVGSGGGLLLHPGMAGGLRG